MPPKRRGRAARTASTPVQDDNAMAVDTPEAAESPEKPAYDPMKDLWTDEQETSLLKGITKWKPAGMHKHFRMIALSGYLRNHGYDPSIDTHTQIQGIWKKLGTSYNLEAIDEREDSFDYDDEVFGERYKEFSLPLDEYGLEMMERGRDRESKESPPAQERGSNTLPTKKRKRGDTTTSRVRASTVEDTDEPKTSPAPSSTVRPRPGRRGRSRAQAKKGSSDRHASRATTVESTDDPATADESVEAATASESAEADTAEEEEEEEEEEEADEDDDGTPSPKASRSRTKAAKGGGTRAQSTQRKSTRKR